MPRSPQMGSRYERAYWPHLLFIRKDYRGMSSTVHPRRGSGVTSGEGQFERGICLWTSLKKGQTFPIPIWREMSVLFLILDWSISPPRRYLDILTPTFCWACWAVSRSCVWMLSVSDRLLRTTLASWSLRRRTSSYQGNCIQLLCKSNPLGLKKKPWYMWGQTTNIIEKRTCWQS